MSIEISNYQRLNNLLLGTKNREDSYFVLNQVCTRDSKLYKVMESVIASRKYDQSLDYDTMRRYINDLSRFMYREDAYELISYVLSRTSDVAQIRTLTRLADMKPHKPEIISLRQLRYRNKENIATKSCPHCGFKCTLSKDTDYVICGYTDPTGYDWQGCGRDWCFKCGKMLCKSWTKDELFLVTNRYHDSKCCKKHAGACDTNYPQDYCYCCTSYVCRD